MATERKRRARKSAPEPDDEPFYVAPCDECGSHECDGTDPHQGVGAPEPEPLAVRVTVEKSIGTATGLDTELSELRRYLEYQTARFLIKRKLTGTWNVLAYVSRTGVK